MNMGIDSSLADLILTNAKVITLDPNQPIAKGVAIAENKILYLQTTPDSTTHKSPKCRIINCHGKPVLPGFIDSHFHLYAFAERFVSLDLGPNNDIRSISDIKSKIRQTSKRRVTGTWIRGFGYNEFYLEEKRHPNRWDLDKATPEHPIKLTHRSGHAHVLNSKALKHVGIALDTPDPPEGLIDRDIHSGEPTGLLYEMGGFLSELIPSLEQREILGSIELANHELLSLGVTSIQDATKANDLERWEAIRHWKEAALFKPRINLMLNPMALEHLETQNFSSCVGETQLRFSGIKIVLDETTGELLPSREELNSIVLKIHKSGHQAVIHAIEENAVGAAYGAIKNALEKFPKSDHRHRIEHGSVCGPNLTKKLADLGIVIVTQPSFIYYNGDRYLETVSAQRLKHLYPIGSLMKAGILVAGSSDSPIVPPNPLIGIYAAVNRKSETGKTIEQREKIKPIDALRMYTEYAARASFEETIKGSITPGKLADLILLNRDPTEESPDKIKDTEVEMTILDGKVVWEKPC